MLSLSYWCASGCHGRIESLPAGRPHLAQARRMLEKCRVSS